MLGLTPSGAVRLVDRLAAAGYVERGPAPTRRTVSLHLTDAGRDAAEQIHAARAEVLDGALAVLTPEERDTFAELTGRMLIGLMQRAGRHALDVPAVRPGRLRARRGPLPGRQRGAGALGSAIGVASGACRCIRPPAAS